MTTRALDFKIAVAIAAVPALNFLSSIFPIGPFQMMVAADLIISEYNLIVSGPISRMDSDLVTKSDFLVVLLVRTSTG